MRSMFISVPRTLFVVWLIAMVPTLVSCSASKSDAELGHLAPEFIKTSLTQTFSNWNYETFRQYAWNKGMRRSGEKSFWFTGGVEEKTPGAGASRFERLQVTQIEYLPPLHVSSQNAFKYASEQLGPLESIESMQMGEKMGQGGNYRIDSLITAKFQRKRAYIYCIVAYGKISGDGFQIAELMPNDFKITYLYVTPLPKEMEKQLGRDSHYGTSKFHDTKLTDLQN